ncbi:hypothetical protein J6590_067558 [Homalodisca vitripennis]|nr:hypothetical protein J6590_067558 [Homalodisca vitripennis]
MSLNPGQTPFSLMRNYKLPSPTSDPGQEFKFFSRRVLQLPIKNSIPHPHKKRQRRTQNIGGLEVYKYGRQGRNAFNVLQPIQFSGGLLHDRCGIAVLATFGMAQFQIIHLAMLATLYDCNELNSAKRFPVGYNNDIDTVITARPFYEAKLLLGRSRADNAGRRDLEPNSHQTEDLHRPESGVSSKYLAMNLDTNLTFWNISLAQ